MPSDKTADHSDKIPTASAYLRLADPPVLLVPGCVPLPEERVKITLTSTSPQTYKEWGKKCT